MQRMYDMDMHVNITYLDRTENPKDQSLYNYQTGAADAKSKVHTDILADVRIAALFTIFLGPLLKPNAAT
jgi:hypothetical protein